MRLKKVILLGFKSFADRTVLEFRPGITGIVGPNGCGKSNIADAFRWVMGEQSAKSMRGNKMPDVIFAGTTQRKPLNLAEVTLIFDEIQGQLPVEYEEVSITRRLHRSGESDYFINGHEVRLKDIHNLFLDSGIGRNAFAIFEQGKIDQIINYGPLERRYIFEEAAGILRFLQRKREALRKLEQAETNTSRVRDIHQEVEKQIIILEQQSEKARLYKEKKTVFESMEKHLYIAKWDSLEKRGSDIKRKESDQQAEVEKIIQHQHTLQTQLDEVRGLLENKENLLKSDSEKVFKTRNIKEMKAKERSDSQERLKEAVSKEKEAQEEIALLKKQHVEREKELTKNKKRQQELTTICNESDGNIKKLKEKEKILDRTVSEQRNQQQQIYQQRLKCIQTENLFESDLKQNKVRAENAQERITSHYLRRDKLAQQMEEYTHQVVEKKQLMQENAESIDKQKAIFVAVEAEIAQISEQLDIAQVGLEKTVSELTEQKARQKALLRLKEEMEGFSAASKRLIQESSNPKSPLYNKVKGLYEYLQPRADAESTVGKALAASMRAYAQTLIVETVDDLNKCIAFATTHHLKDFSLFCMEHLTAAMATKKSNEPQSGRHKTKAKAHPLMLQMTEHPLATHFLEHITLVETLADTFQAQQDQGKEWWVKEGSFVDRHKVIFYVGENENNPFTRTSELNRIDKKIKEREQNKLTLENAIKTLQQKRTDLQRQRTDIDKNMRKDEMKLIEINFALQRLNGDLEKGRIECLQIEQEVKNLQESVKKISDAIADLEKKRITAQKQTAELQQQLDQLENTLKGDSERLRKEQQTIQEQQASYQKVLDESRQVSHLIHLHEVKEQESHQRLARLEQEISRSREYQIKVSQQTQDCDQTLVEVEKNLTDITTACKKLEETIQKHKQTVKNLEAEIKQESEKLRKKEMEVNQLHLQGTQQESSRRGIEQELQERYGMSIAELRLTLSPINSAVEQLEGTLRALRHEIEALGDVNMTSIEEYDKHKVRYNFLNEQIDDMVSSEAELLKIIGELDSESRKIFKETFELIRTNFRKNFAILFNGGEADLQFTETQDVLEAGIEIIAKPPGKQMRSIQLLSGGEKCLTALALLFAIFEVKPAPFCILDEIDAPLDDSNVERFANVMKQFIEKCQFLIITHNKRTMAIADVLFGVSMQERGVSKILSMEFSQDTDLETVPAQESYTHI